MAHVYSTYEAKARFSEVLRKVRAGQRVIIAYRGEEIAEIRPLEDASGSLEKTLARLEDQGVLGRSATVRTPLRALAKRPGALKRFLESRE
jgi:prevent-host-death family protein